MHHLGVYNKFIYKKIYFVFLDESACSCVDGDVTGGDYSVFCGRKRVGLYSLFLFMCGLKRISVLLKCGLKRISVLSRCGLKRILVLSRGGLKQILILVRGRLKRPSESSVFCSGVDCSCTGVDKKIFFFSKTQTRSQWDISCTCLGKCSAELLDVDNGCLALHSTCRKESVVNTSVNTVLPQ